MGKSYRRHHKRPKRKNTRRRRRGGKDGDTSSSTYGKWGSMLSPSMQQSLYDAHQKGLEMGQRHIDSAKQFTKDMHQKTQDYMNQASSAAQPYMAKGKEYYGQASSAVQPHIQRFSSLSSNNPNVKELEHAQDQATLGTPMQNDPYNIRQTLSP